MYNPANLTAPGAGNLAGPPQFGRTENSFSKFTPRTRWRSQAGQFQKIVRIMQHFGIDPKEYLEVKHQYALQLLANPDEGLDDTNEKVFESALLMLQKALSRTDILNLIHHVVSHIARLYVEYIPKLMESLRVNDDDEVSKEKMLKALFDLCSHNHLIASTEKGGRIYGSEAISALKESLEVLHELNNGTFDIANPQLPVIIQTFLRRVCNLDPEGADNLKAVMGERVNVALNDDEDDFTSDDYDSYEDEEDAAVPGEDGFGDSDDDDLTSDDYTSDDSGLSSADWYV
jgi:hypothetical protein